VELERDHAGDSGGDDGVTEVLYDVNRDHGCYGIVGMIVLIRSARATASQTLWPMRK
jgi:hypothetical protein